MLDEKDGVYTPSADFVKNAHITSDTYDAMYASSVSDPEGFWGEHGRSLDWIKPYTKVKDTSFAHDDVHVKWF
ncbi:MAG: acetyl-coenzyme A synthetase N-terminal domain-containing protein, partial [Pseudomonadota bacterium]